MLYVESSLQLCVFLVPLREKKSLCIFVTENNTYGFQKF
jgi:hypothetical protein